MKFFCVILVINLIFRESTGNDISSSENELPQGENDTNKAIEKNEPILIKSFDVENDPLKETQMAQCTVSSGDIKASAQATFSVKGFCLSRDMEKLKETFFDIETRLLREIYHLRVMIEKSLPPGQYKNDYSYPNYYQENRQYTSYRQPSATPKTDYIQKQNQQVNQYPTTESPRTIMTQSILLTTTTTSTTTKMPAVNTFLKSLESSKNKAKQKQNSKTADVPVQSKNEYIFYWKLDKFPKEFLHAKKNEIFSHVFNVKGLFLRIRAVLKFDENESLFLDVEHLANVDNDDSMKFEISDGLVFKEIAEEKLFQFSFVIMDQKVNLKHDLISPVYWNTDSDGFLISNSVHVLSNYVKNEALLIKLKITF